MPIELVGLSKIAILECNMLSFDESLELSVELS